MFEDIIAVLETAGIEFIEDYEGGTITIDIAGMDKAELVMVISTVNDTGAEFMIDDIAITITGLDQMGLEEVDAGLEDDLDMQQMALDEMF